MKKILIYSGLVCILLSSCKKDLTSLNVDPKNPSAVPAYTLFTYAQKNLSDNLASPNVNLNIFRLITQAWTETTYTDESNYDISTRNIPQNWFHSFYRDVLRNLEDARNLIPGEVVDPIKRKNQLAIVDVMKVYSYHYLFTTFGNVPYSEALNLENTQPKYDDAKTAYTSLMTTLNTAIGNMAAGESFGSADIIYGGDIAMWKKFANSLKLKMALMMADYDAAAAATAAAAASTGVFTSNADNAKFAYLGAPPNTNPVWVNLVQSGRKDFVVTSTIVNQMTANSDPRIPLFFTTDAGGGYSGGIPGANNNYATFSKPSLTIQAEAFPYTLMDYAEVEFLLAEAVARGFAGVSGTAAGHYANAVTASITDWGGSTGAATTYLTQPGVVYNPANYKQSIGTQKWLAMFDRGHDAWTEWRRLDYPALVAPPTALSTIPKRFTYPVSEQNLNKSNYDAASAAVGGDNVATKLWFDKF
ncbi:MAG: SusD/RagB family nutrient-binding outer membrane lipoprotein [Chitinophagaceae bacterium]|nr:SusD/RagB family nutrient-binding outer membrane lipoprotein [Chitinophagaceae bacterium]